ncbi:hypothetical protein [Mycetocola manganoxydans]|nr:hypothetical protein [Mycetocola manganoxydans]GHD38827.1 hypothetical protein GCM10008097_00870 [Mycetocola manganoxydans]
MTLRGELTTFTDALGSSMTDGRSIAAFVAVDLPTARSDYDLGDSHRTYLKSTDKGVEFVYEDGRLRSVFISTIDNPIRRAYPRPDALIEGLSGTATRGQVLKRFGEPEWTSEEADRFKLAAACYVRFAYENGRVVLISVMREVPQ